VCAELRQMLVMRFGLSLGNVHFRDCVRKPKATAVPIASGSETVREQIWWESFTFVVGEVSEFPKFRQGWHAPSD
jgi:hypothetical protein